MWRELVTTQAGLSPRVGNLLKGPGAAMKTANVLGGKLLEGVGRQIDGVLDVASSATVCNPNVRAFAVAADLNGFLAQRMVVRVAIETRPRIPASVSDGGNHRRPRVDGAAGIQARGVESNVSAREGLSTSAVVASRGLRLRRGSRRGLRLRGRRRGSRSRFGSRGRLVLSRRCGRRGR